MASDGGVADGEALQALKTLLIPRFEASFNADGTILSVGAAALDTRVTLYNDSPHPVVADVRFYSERPHPVGVLSERAGPLVHDFTMELAGRDVQAFSVAEMLRGVDPRALPCSHRLKEPRIGVIGPYPAAYLFQTLYGLDSSLDPDAAKWPGGPHRPLTNPIHGYMTVGPLEGGSLETSIRADYTLGVGENGGAVRFAPPTEASPETACFLMKTIIVPGGNTPEGRLVEAVAPAWLEIIELLTRRPGAAYEISPRKWEELIAGAYTRAGFEEVTLTPWSGDHGRDVIAVKRGLGQVRVIDQVKAYKPGHLVTADDVRALMGVLHTDGAAKGFLTTTSDFAPRLSDDPLIRPFMPSRLELINGVRLLERLKELAMRER